MESLKCLNRLGVSESLDSLECLGIWTVCTWFAHKTYQNCHTSYLQNMCLEFLNRLGVCGILNSLE